MSTATPQGAFCPGLAHYIPAGLLSFSPTGGAHGVLPSLLRCRASALPGTTIFYLPGS